MMNGFLTAVRTLTLIPLPGRHGNNFSSSLPWFPVIGLVLGFLLYLPAMIWFKWVPAEWSAGGAFMVIVLEIILTRGLHLDGLADWADALGSRADPEIRLTVMKDSRIGAFGVIALVIVLLGKWLALSKLFSDHSLQWIPLVLVISRDMMVELITTLPYARSDSGTASPFVRGATPRHRVIAHMMTCFGCLWFGLPGVAVFIIAWVVTRLLGMSFRKIFRGITGDLLGTTNEILETVLLFICALIGNLSWGYAHW
ncbi:MAG: adenosylcobinamide-GDP ribazoletransferase, partial [Deltaproteobacteria bacterium]|nr:adenosylcobinamide-GDP ribazoletransferase [Deltaproteobacteria bacterium]